jgi:hypothetical protein
MTPNTALLEKTMQHLLDHPEQHDQDHVYQSSCDTPGCFVGWAMHLAGIDYLTAGVSAVVWARSPEGLGLGDEDAETIFHSLNTRAALQLMVKDLVNGGCLEGDFRHYDEEAGNA